MNAEEEWYSLKARITRVMMLGSCLFLVLILALLALG